jgi:type IX secretion system substrate protein
MKNIIPIFFVVSTILILSNQMFSQEEKYHQVIFGNTNSNEQFLYIPFDQEIITTEINQTYNNYLEIQTDFTMAYIWIYNETGFEIFDQINTNFATFSVPSGYYNVFTGYAPQNNEHTFIIKENVDVTTNSQLKLLKREAIYSNIYTFNKIDSDTLNISTIAFNFENLLPVINLAISHININSNIFELKHNTLPSHFIGEWAVKGKPFYNDYDLYLLNNQLYFFEADTIITNNVSDYSYADLDYFLIDSILTSSEKQIFTFIPDAHTWGSGDIFYTFPLTQRIYQDTSANEYLRSSKFWQDLICHQINYPFSNIIFTSEMRFKDGKIMGYHFRDPNAPYYILSDTNYVRLGQPPSFWYGQFSNSIDTIKIQSPYGQWPYLFLNQTNDLLQHHPIDYKISQNLALIDSGQFNLWYGPWALRLGFDRNDLAILIQPGEYTINIKNNFNQIGNIKGYSEVNASFDLNKVDNNPPNIISFQLLSGKLITHKFYNHSNNKIRFIAEDNVLIDSISLNYSYLYDSIKYEIPLTFNNPYFEGFLPELPPGYFNLHTYIMDNSQNYIECNMSPAFVVDSSVLSVDEPKFKVKEFELYQNYPNPFNHTTNIIFTLPKSAHVKLEIYNIIGQKIVTLVNTQKTTGTHSIQFDATHLASGVYFYRIEINDNTTDRFVKTQKMLLLK